MDTSPLTQAFPAPLLGHTIIHRERVDSTNNVLQALAREGAAEGTVVTADFQTAGRGRRGASWQASPRQSLLFSLLLHPSGDIPSGLFAGLAACALAHALEQRAELAPRIKWPNDLLLGEKKVAGILIEKAASGAVIAGVGLNIHQSEADFPPELQPLASSLAVASPHHPWDRPSLLQTILQSWNALYSQNDWPHTVITHWRQRLAWAGRPVILHLGTRTHTGCIESLGPRGELLLAEDDGHITSHWSADKLYLAPKN